MHPSRLVATSGNNTREGREETGKGGEFCVWPTHGRTQISRSCFREALSELSHQGYLNCLGCADLGGGRLSDPLKHDVGAETATYTAWRLAPIDEMISSFLLKLMS